MVLWWFINNKEHSSLTVSDKKIESLMLLVSALFPGINYYSVTGFGQVMHECVIPAVKKKFPELAGQPEKSIAPSALTEITKFLPSKGYEWQESDAWKARFKRLLQSA